MQVHNPAYCCTTMEEYITSNLVTVNYVAKTAHMNVIHTPTPANDADPNPIVTRIPIAFCPNCGVDVKTYSELVPQPTYTRGVTNGSSCDDVTCRFNNTVTLKCAYAYRNESGCFAVNEATKQSVEDLRSKLNMAENEMLSQ